MYISETSHEVNILDACAALEVSALSAAHRQQNAPPVPSPVTEYRWTQEQVRAHMKELGLSPERNKDAKLPIRYRLCEQRKPPQAERTEEPMATRPEYADIAPGHPQFDQAQALVEQGMSVKDAAEKAGFADWRAFEGARRRAKFPHIVKSKPTPHTTVTRTAHRRTAAQGQERPIEPTGTGTPGVLPGGHVGDTRGTGREERDVAALTGGTGYPAGECIGGHVGHALGGAMRHDVEYGWTHAGEDDAFGVASGDVGDAKCVGYEGQSRWRSGPEPADGYARDDRRTQPRLGRDADGSALGLHLPDRWPAGRGAEQYPWEPPRTVPGGSVKGRGARLKMLGNMVVPRQALVLFEEIVRAEADV